MDLRIRDDFLRPLSLVYLRLFGLIALVGLVVMIFTFEIGLIIVIGGVMYGIATTVLSYVMDRLGS